MLVDVALERKNRAIKPTESTVDANFQLLEQFMHILRLLIEKRHLAKLRNFHKNNNGDMIRFNTVEREAASAMIRKSLLLEQILWVWKRDAKDEILELVQRLSNQIFDMINAYRWDTNLQGSTEDLISQCRTQQYVGPLIMEKFHNCKTYVREVENPSG